MVDINDFEQEKTCTYKDEVYSVRDNGAIMRHIREGKPKRKNDNLWTFGKPNLISGYLEFAGERVHRIVACAFLGDPPTDQHVVDHIDTNRHNNRPDNLRWLTRLENALNNPITRAKIEMICGSIEAFIQNPSILHKYESKDTNFSWMRRVSPEEAKAAYEHWMEWANKTKEDRIPKNGGIGPGDWIFSFKEDHAEESEDNDTSEKTKVFQYWKSKVIDRTEESYFPLSPRTTEEGEDVLQKYMNALVPGVDFLISRDYKTVFREVCYFKDENKFRVLTERINAQRMSWYIFEIWAEGDYIIHKSVGNYTKNKRKDAELALRDLSIFHKDEWKYKRGQDTPTISFPSMPVITPQKPPELPIEENKDYYPANNIEQRNWKTPTEFPMCPDGMPDNPLDAYMKQMIKGDVFCRNRYGESILVDVGYSPNKEELIVLTHQPEGIKKWYLSGVYIEKGHYVHESVGSYFGEDGGRKYFTILTGGEWTGGDVFDDYC